MNIPPLRDSNLDGLIYSDRDSCGLFMRAIDALSQQVAGRHNSDSGPIHWISFSGSSQYLGESLDPPIWYEVQSLGKRNNAIIPTEMRIFTSHYIGYYETNLDVCGQLRPISIEIVPRFGEFIRDYLIEYAAGLYMFGESRLANSKGGSLWLLAVLWKAAVEQAITRSHIPREYRSTTENLTSFRGSLSLRDELNTNLTNHSRFYCRYRKITFSTVINCTMRRVYHILARDRFGGIVQGLAEYDERLASLGVPINEVSGDEIRSVRYSRLTQPYRRVMEISEAIISYNSTKSNATGHRNSFCYFLDMAELWELYLLRILQKNLNPEYRVYSPNLDRGEALFSDGSREIRPDILIELKGRLVAILDAKYKMYNHLGRTAQHSDAVSREDLYQMSTYLAHYGCDKPLIGLFVCPTECQEQPHQLVRKPYHFIGVAGLDISKFNKDTVSPSRSALHQAELEFAHGIDGMIRRILQLA